MSEPDEPDVPQGDRPVQLPAVPPEVTTLTTVDPGTSTATRVFPVQSPTQAGDTLLVIMAIGGNTFVVNTMTDSKGNRYVKTNQVANATPNCFTFHCEGPTGGPLVGGDPSPTRALTTSDTMTVTSAAATGGLGMLAVHLRGVGALDRQNWATEQSGPPTPVIDVSVTPRTAGQAAVVLSANQGGGGVPDWDPPFIRLASGQQANQHHTCAYVLEAGPAGQPIRARSQLAGSGGWRGQLYSFFSEIQVTTAELPVAIEGIPYEAQLAATGGLPPYEWWGGGVMPAGLTLLLDGTIHGTPLPGISADYPVMFRAIDAVQAYGDRSFTIRVLPGVRITTTALPEGSVGRPYTAALAATGGAEPYTWTATGLPPGLAITGAQITGTPTEAGESEPEITVTDSAGGTYRAQFVLTIEALPPLEILTAALPGGQIGQSYTATMQASGGVPPYSWTSTGLPPGLAMSGATISGVPTADGDFTPEITVTDEDATTAQRSYPVTIEAEGELAITTTGLERAIIDQPYAAVIEAEGGTVPYIWSVRGLPPGLEPANQVWPALTVGITGTPTRLGEYEITANVADWEGHAAEALLGLDVIEAPEIPEPEPERVPLVPVIWNGLDLNAGDRDDGITLVTTDVDGWYGSPPQQGNDLDRALTDGAVFGAKVTGRRTITLTGAAIGPHNGLVLLSRELAALTVARVPAPLTIREGDDPAMPMLTAMVRAGEDRLNCAWRGRSYLTWQVVLTAADPRLHEDRWRNAELRFALDEGTGRDYPYQPPRAYALTILPNSARLANPGNVPAIVTITYTGPLDETRLTDGTGRMIRVAALAQDQQIIVDSGSLVAVAPGGAPRASYILAGSQPMTVPAGQGAIWRLAGNGSGTVALAWRGAWT
jgi:hypothetical protein